MKLLLGLIALANQNKNQFLKDHFSKIYADFEGNKSKIHNELIEAQGKSIDIGGYYLPNAEKAAKAMRPSNSFNKILEAIAI